MQWILRTFIDWGIHPPTIYFSPYRKEAMMIEPTETESKESLDYFIDAMKIALLAKTDPQSLHQAPIVLLLAV